MMNLHEAYVDGIAVLSADIEKLKSRKQEMEEIDPRLGKGMDMSIHMHRLMLEHAKEVLNRSDAVEMVKYYEELKPFFEGGVDD